MMRNPPSIGDRIQVAIHIIERKARPVYVAEFRRSLGDKLSLLPQ